MMGEGCCLNQDLQDLRINKIIVHDRSRIASNTPKQEGDFLLLLFFRYKRCSFGLVSSIFIPLPPSKGEFSAAADLLV
ncbi:hypothetical protein L1278_003872 [Pontibacter sp. HSC-36F09]|nr:hypothetical protein [Pontibacter sp. HSC-36F09]